MSFLAFSTSSSSDSSSTAQNSAGIQCMFFLVLQYIFLVRIVCQLSIMWQVSFLAFYYVFKVRYVRQLRRTQQVPTGMHVLLGLLIYLPSQTDRQTCRIRQVFACLSCSSAHLSSQTVRQLRRMWHVHLHVHVLPGPLLVRQLRRPQDERDNCICMYPLIDPLVHF